MMTKNRTIEAITCYPAACVLQWNCTVEKHCVDGSLSSEFVFIQLMMEKRVIVLGCVELDGTVLIVLLSLQEGEANE